MFPLAWRYLEVFRVWEWQYHLVRVGASGSGPSGKWQMGDSGGVDIKACKDCGKASDGLPYPIAKAGKA